MIFAGELLGRAAMWAGLQSAESSSYGAEARGSACHAGVIISDQYIPYPKVRRPDLLIALSQGAFDKFLPTVKGGGQAVFDADLVDISASSSKREDIILRGFFATAAATRLGRRSVANVVLLAAALASNFSRTDILVCPISPSREALAQAIVEQSPEAFRKINLTALEEGWKSK
ncbi:MAG: 2-oxoacid:acceptor oxidoreductase family protein [Calditrichota bacterium]